MASAPNPRDLAAELLPDVDEALKNYGVAFTSTVMPDDVRARAFEEGRLAMRRVRERLAEILET